MAGRCAIAPTARPRSTRPSTASSRRRRAGRRASLVRETNLDDGMSIEETFSLVSPRGLSIELETSGGVGRRKPLRRDLRPRRLTNSQNSRFRMQRRANGVGSAGHTRFSMSQTTVPNIFPRLRPHRSCRARHRIHVGHRQGHRPAAGSARCRRDRQRAIGGARRRGRRGHPVDRGACRLRGVRPDRRGAVPAARGPCGGALRPARHPRQQRGRHLARRRAHHDHRGLGPHPRHQPARAVLPDAGGGAASRDARAAASSSTSGRSTPTSASRS